MRRLILLFTLVAGSTAAQTLPNGVILWPKGVPTGGPDQKVNFGDHILWVAAHDGEPGAYEAHTSQDDVFYIQSGTSDFLVGGTGVNMQEVSPGEVHGTGIDGATRVHLAAGDVITIPAGMVHSFQTRPGEKISYLVVKVVKKQPITPPAPAMAGLPNGVILWHNGTPPEGLLHKENFGDHILYGYHRSKSGNVEYHETMDDVFVVEKGAGDFIVGGTGINMHPTAKGEQQGSSIDGATRLHLQAGDVLTIPANMPHQFLLEPGQTLDYFIIKIVK